MFFKVNVFPLEKDTAEERNSLHSYYFHMNFALCYLSGTELNTELKYRYKSSMSHTHRGHQIAVNAALGFCHLRSAGLIMHGMLILLL